MIIDCHTHVWPASAKLGQAVEFSWFRVDPKSASVAQRHLSAQDTAHVSLVLGFVSDYLEAEISNDFLREHVNANPNKLIGFAGIDPTRSGCAGQIRRLHEDGFRGLVISPACQNFHPCDTRVWSVYETAQALKMPVYVLLGDRLPSKAILDYANPIHFDEVARMFPELKLVISNMGFPWGEPTIAMLAKHKTVFATVTGLATKSWQAYRMLTLAYEFDVVGKLLFGSGFPVHDPKTAVEALYNLNNITRDSVLPVVPREHLRGIVERNSLELLGLA